MPRERRVRIHAAVILVAVCAFADSRLISAENGWSPAKTWVFAVGLLEWKDSADLASFPKKGRRDSMLVSFFKERGVPTEHIRLLQDSAATTAAVRGAFKKILPLSGPGDTLFVYYCGHGYDQDGTTYFATYDAGNTAWAVPDIFDSIESHYNGSQVVLMADCCHSGALADVAKKRQTKIEYACLSSVLASETSTACWTFSDSLLDVLEGAPQADLNRDGVVTLGEAAQYIKGEMAFFDEQTATSFISRGLSPEWRVSISENQKSNNRVGEHVEIFQNAGLRRAQIEDFKDGKFQVRFASTAEREEAWVPESSIRTMKTEPKTPTAVLVVGEAVRVEWKKRWWPAKILKVNENEKQYFIAYDGYGEEWNEWVGPKRIRNR